MCRIAGNLKGHSYIILRTLTFLPDLCHHLLSKSNLHSCSRDINATPCKVRYVINFFSFYFFFNFTPSYNLIFTFVPFQVLHFLPFCVKTCHALICCMCLIVHPPHPTHLRSLYSQRSSLHLCQFVFPL